jgi:hypothetical protein
MDVFTKLREKRRGKKKGGEVRIRTRIGFGSSPASQAVCPSTQERPTGRRSRNESIETTKREIRVELGDPAARRRFLEAEAALHFEPIARIYRKLFAARVAADRARGVPFFDEVRPGVWTRV